MSHIVIPKVDVRDPTALAAACTRLHLKPPLQGTAKLYTNEATGLIVELPGWAYPVVIDTAKREIHVDNFGGAWGDQKELDKLLQAYAIEKCRIEARKAGHQVLEQSLPDGSIKVTIQVAGGA